MITANDHIAKLETYPLADLSAFDGVRLISMAQNESYRAPSPRALEAGFTVLTQSSLYPDPDWTGLRRPLANAHGLKPETILCGSGSMELISSLARAFAGSGRTVLTTQYGYALFPSAAAELRARCDVAPEVDLTVSVDALLDAVQPDTRLVFVANPGNPTGTRISRSELVRLRDNLPEQALLVIDEAYGEFADGLDEPLFDLVEHGDTVILRTLSKAYGLAGARVGWGVFPPSVAAEVRKVLNPNNVSGVSQAMAVAAVEDQTYMRETCDETARLREAFAKDVRGLSLHVPDSYTNFILITFPDAAEAARADRVLRSKNVLMRTMGGYGLGHCLRATIVEESDMAVALDGLRRWRSGEDHR